MAELNPGDVVWAFLDPTVGREQRRPVVVVSGVARLTLADTLVAVVPVTSVDHGWSNHLRLHEFGLARDSWAMTEQIRSISRERIIGRIGRIDPWTLRAIRGWISDFLDL
jgi:mRNA interferase MazF